MEIIEISASEKAENLMLKKTPTYRLTKDQCLKVDAGYVAEICLICNKPRPVSGWADDRKPKRIYKEVGKEYLGIEYYVLFYRKQGMPDLNWAVGNIAYDYGNKVCVFGTRGEMVWSVYSYARLTELLGGESGTFQRGAVENIIRKRVAEKFGDVLKELFREVGVAITNEAFLKDEFECRLNERYASREIEALPGMIISEIRLATIVIRTYDRDDPALAAKAPEYVAPTKGSVN